jgi:hypothetical protein
MKNKLLAYEEVFTVNSNVFEQIDRLILSSKKHDSVVNGYMYAGRNSRKGKSKRRKR